MKFPLIFKRENSSAAARARQDKAEKLVAESLRVLGQVFSKLADAVDAQRLTRAGYAEQEKFLKRTESKDEKDS
jgi:hypothetical protein